MTANDILRLLFDVKIAPRILAGNFWMTKSVQRMFVVLICVPIVEIKVVQQRTDEQCMRIGADVQAAIEPAAYLCDIFAVLQRGYRAVCTCSFAALSRFLGKDGAFDIARGVPAKSKSMAYVSSFLPNFLILSYHILDSKMASLQKIQEFFIKCTVLLLKMVYYIYGIVL